MASKAKGAKKAGGRREILITGFPGFLAGRLLDELLRQDGTAHFHFLVLPAMEVAARRRLEVLAQSHPTLFERTTLHRGDITDPRLGLSADLYDELAGKITSVWHLAAIYDLAVGEEIAYRVNVMGTVHVLDFCGAASRFERLNYVSTCYVSGERKGKIYESELDEGQAHKNFYEATKFWAEVEVQRRRDKIPTAIFRPGITVGDSRTGETEKYDGPYYFFKVVNQLPRWMPMPNVGRGDALVNIVPIDFVAQAMAYIGTTAGMEDKVYHIADPNPMRARDILAMILAGMDRPGPVGSAPAHLLEKALGSKTIQNQVGVPKEALIYFNHDARYDTSNTQRALKDTTIRCPHLSSYLQQLIDFYLRHPDL
jgi:thioester reductase-like protein